MKKLFAFPVAFSDPAHNGNPLYPQPVTCHVFDDEGEAWELYRIDELANVIGLRPEAFDEFAEEDGVYITAMAFVEMCYYSRGILSYVKDKQRTPMLVNLQEMAIDLLGAAAAAHFPAQAKIYEQRLAELRNETK